MRRTISDGSKAEVGTQYLYCAPTVPPTKWPAMAQPERKAGWIPVGCKAWISVPETKTRETVHITTTMWAANATRNNLAARPALLSKSEMRWRAIRRLTERWQTVATPFTREDRKTILSGLFRTKDRKRFKPTSLPSVAKFGVRLHNLLQRAGRTDALKVIGELTNTLDELILRRAINGRFEAPAEATAGK